MKEFLLTLRFLLSQNLSLGHRLYRIKHDSRSRRMMFLIIAVIILCTPSYALFIGLFIRLFNTLKSGPLDMSMLFIIMAVILSLLLIILLGFFQIISYFFFSDDIKILTPFPIKPRYYLVSKFIVIYIWELLVSVFAVLPFFIIYAVFEKLSVINWIAMLVNFALLPVIPLVVIGVITILLMMVSHVFKSKDAVNMVGYIILIIGVFGLEFSFVNSAISSPKNFYDILVNNSLLTHFSAYYPVTHFIDWALTGSWYTAILSSVAFIIVTVIFVYFFSWFLEAFFLKTYLTEQNNPIKRRKARYISYKGRTAARAVAKVDFNTLLRVPMYALNTLSIVVIIPVILLFYVFIGHKTGMSFSSIIPYYNNHIEIVWLIVTLFLGATSAMNPIASTTFSREGKTNWIMRTLPIESNDHIIGRALTAVYTELAYDIVIVTILIIMLTQNGASLGTSLLYAIFAIIMSLIIALGLIFTGIYLDLRNPKLKWDNPNQAVKQNVNSLFSMGIAVIYSAVSVLLFKLLYSFLPVPVIVLIFIIINVVLVYAAYTRLIRKFQENLVIME